MQTFIFIEAINIEASVYDTDQLSVIRGSSCLLKEAIRHIQDTFQDCLTALSTGASSGLFVLRDPQTGITKLIDSIKQELGKHPYEYFVFLVESCDAEDLLGAKEKLLTLLRFHQMRSITSVPDRISADRSSLKQPCGLEGRRIASKNPPKMVQGRPRRLSESVFQRLKMGRERRQIHRSQDGDPKKLAILEKYRSSDDFESLAGNPENPEHKKLKNKIAVIYIDGNKFSELQRRTLEQAIEPEEMNQAQIDFDLTIQTERSNFLLDILLAMVKNEIKRFPDALYEVYCLR
ncbi:MAG: hypothetical protein ACRESZ_19850 [Methylococcales bacterium]